MKLEKKEITLNEKDSFKDIYYFERALANAYERKMGEAERKECRTTLKNLLKNTREDEESARRQIEKL